MHIGYVRVSANHQNLDRQLTTLRAAGCKRIFKEKESGREGVKRKELERAIAALGDVRTIAPDHERRREDILGELQGLARGIGMFRQPPAPPQSPEELPPYRRANGLRERIIALGDGRQVTSNSSSLTIIPK